MRRASGRWAVALRIARRSALTSWGRSLLIVALIAAPIAGLAGAAVFLPSTRSTPQERVDNRLGDAQAVLSVAGRPGDRLHQDAEGDGWSGSPREADVDEDAVDPRTVLPSGTRVLAIGFGSATLRSPNGPVSLDVVTGESWDRTLDGGPYVLLSGRRPAAADEVLLSPGALARLGVRIGGTVEVTAPSVRTLTVVGTSRVRALPSSAQTVFSAAELLPEVQDVERLTYYVPSAPVDWTTVERLNEAGTTAFSRRVVLDPPPLDVTTSRSDDAGLVAVIAILLVFALLEVALLAGAAFLVGARLQQRTLAVIASIGADRAVLRRVVTANGVVLGAIGGVVGVGFGIAGAVVLMRLTDDGSWVRYPGLHVVWSLLLGIAAFGVVVGWIAALVPARAASRFDVVRALRGARTPQRVGRRPVPGIVLLVVGVAATLLGGVVLAGVVRPDGGEVDRSGAQLLATALLGGGPVLAQLGVLLCSGLVLRGIARLLERAPLPARVAARDTSRNLGRAVPAAASMMTTVFVAAFVMCLAGAISLSNATTHTWVAGRVGDAVSSITTGTEDSPTTADAARYEEALRRDLPVRSLATVSVTAQSPTSTTSDRLRDAIAVVRSAPTDCDPERQRVADDLRCGPFSAAGGSATWLTVGTPRALGLLLGHAPSAAALESLQQGGAVALRTGLTSDGAATLDWYTPQQWDDMGSVEPRRTTRLPAVVDLPAHPLQDVLFVTPATASRLDMATTPERIALTFSRTPAQAQLDSANTALGVLANQPGTSGLIVEAGPQDYGSTVAWWVLLGCLVIAVSAGATAIGLARVDGRADDITLASLGASPRIRRWVGAVQALIVCGVGAAIGTVLGLLPAFALGLATTSLPFAPPVLQLLLVAVGIPVVIAAGSWLFVGTRRGDLTRRAAIA